MGEPEERIVGDTHRENAIYQDVLGDFIETLVRTDQLNETYTGELITSLHEELTRIGVTRNTDQVKEDLRGMLRARASTESPNEKAREFIEQSIRQRGGCGTNIEWILDNSLFTEQLRRGAEECDPLTGYLEDAAFAGLLFRMTMEIKTPPRDYLDSLLQEMKEMLNLDYELIEKIVVYAHQMARKYPECDLQTDAGFVQSLRRMVPFNRDKQFYADLMLYISRCIGAYFNTQYLLHVLNESYHVSAESIEEFTTLINQQLSKVGCLHEILENEATMKGIRRVFNTEAMYLDEFVSDFLIAAARESNREKSVESTTDKGGTAEELPEELSSQLTLLIERCLDSYGPRQIPCVLRTLRSELHSEISSLTDAELQGIVRNYYNKQENRPLQISTRPRSEETTEEQLNPGTLEMLSKQCEVLIQQKGDLELQILRSSSLDLCNALEENIQLTRKLQQENWRGPAKDQLDYYNTENTSLSHQIQQLETALSLHMDFALEKKLQSEITAIEPKVSIQREIFENSGSKHSKLSQETEKLVVLVNKQQSDNSYHEVQLVKSKHNSPGFIYVFTVLATILIGLLIVTSKTDMQVVRLTN